MFFPPKAMPDNPVVYQLMPSGPHIKWWRVLLGIPTFALTYMLLAFALMIAFVPVYGLDNLNQLGNGNIDLQDPTQLAFLTLSLAIAIIVSYLAFVLSFGIKPGFLGSVAGKLRWSWMAIAFLISGFFSFVLIFGTAVVDSGGLPQFNPNPRLALMLILIVCLVPLQSAAEEYVFRGYLPHLISALLPWRNVALAVGLVASTLLFAAAHGSFDPSTFTQLGSFAVVAWVLTYRTGGLEAAIAFHAMNNTVIFVLEMFIGKSDSLVGKDTVTPWSGTIITMIAMLIEGAVLLWAYGKWEARKSQRTHLTNPALRPVPTQEFLYSAYQRGELYPEYFLSYPPAVQAQMVQLYPYLQAQLPAGGQPLISPQAAAPVAEQAPYQQY